VNRDQIEAHVLLANLTPQAQARANERADTIIADRALTGDSKAIEAVARHLEDRCGGYGADDLADLSIAAALRVRAAFYQWRPKS
jgi:hypothetical protein